MLLREERTQFGIVNGFLRVLAGLGWERVQLRTFSGAACFVC